MHSAPMLVPIVTYPDHRMTEFDRSGEWTLSPLTPYLGAKKVFLTNARAISLSETIMAIVEHYRLGEIVGGPAAGTNGNINPFPVPGGYRITWTGMQVLKHDGSPHHGAGIARRGERERRSPGTCLKLAPVILWIQAHDSEFEKKMNLASQSGINDSHHGESANQEGKGHRCV